MKAHEIPQSVRLALEELKGALDYMKALRHRATLGGNGQIRKFISSLSSQEVLQHGVLRRM